MGGGATKQAATAATAAGEAQHLVSEIDNSNSFLHLNVHTTFILGVVSLIILILLLFMLPCLCCKNVGRMCRWCCSGCQATEMQPSTPWGAWPQPAFRLSGICSTQLQLEAYKTALPHQQVNSQGPSTLSHPPRPRPVSEPTWNGERMYPSVPLAPPISQESSTEDFP